jgi:hypothetical protein
MVVKKLNERGQWREKRSEGEGLMYWGYITLTKMRRESWNGKSEVNTTLYERVSYQHHINTRKGNKNDDDNVRVNFIIGMLLFLECLKQSESEMDNQINISNDREVNR